MLIIARADDCIRFTPYDGDSRSIIMPGCKDQQRMRVRSE